MDRFGRPQKLYIPNLGNSVAIWENRFKQFVVFARHDRISGFKDWRLSLPVATWSTVMGELMGFAEPQSIAVTQMNLVVTFYANGGKFALHAESEGHYDNVVDTFDQMAKWATKLGFPQDPFQLVKSIAHPNLHFMPKSDLADFTARKISKGEFEPYPWWIWGQI